MFCCGFRDIYCLKVKILFGVYHFSGIFDLNNLKIKIMVKKLQAYALGVILSTGAVGHAQYAEVNPATVPTQTTTSNNATTALFDLLFNYAIGDEIGNNGNAGVAYINGEIWVTAWASNEIRILSPDGLYLESM